MLGGIVFQMGKRVYNTIVKLEFRADYLIVAAITVYVALAVEFVFRFWHDRPVRKSVTDADTQRLRFVDRKTKLMLFGLGLSSLFIFIRCVDLLHHVYDLTDQQYLRSVYRTIELSDGWSGRIISTQVLFSEYLVHSCLIEWALTYVSRRFGWCHDHSCLFHAQFSPSWFSLG